MLINRIINVDEDFGSGEVEEPVTLQEVKDYLRLGGFVNDTSGEQDFDFDDQLIGDMINEARLWLEQFTGQYIVPRSLTVVLLNQGGGQELPGPVSGSVVFKNYAGDTIDLTTIGSLFPKVQTCWSSGCEINVRVVGSSSINDNITAIYDAGYDTVPAWVKNAIKAYIADHYEYRGDDKAPAPNERASQIARTHRKGGRSWG